MGNLYIAIQGNDIPSVKRIIKDHPNQLTDVNEYGITPILYALYTNKPDIAKLLYQAKHTFTIHECVGMDDLSCVADILDKAPEKAMEFSMDGWTPLHLAAFWGHQDMLDMLLKRGAQIDRPSLSDASFGNSPLQAAIGKGQVKAVRLLLERGANVAFSQEPSHLTPLHIAASRSNIEIVQLLLEWGADPQVMSADFLTPIDVAKERNHLEIVQLLESWNKES